MPLDDYNKSLKASARKLRQSSTFAEKSLWKHVLSKKRTGFGFKRQRPFGPYIADFLSQEIKLIIEVDGEYHSTPEQQTKDMNKNSYIESHGFKILRVKNDDVIKNLEGVARYISQVISKLENERH